MSDVFDLDTSGQQQLTALAKSNPVPIDQVGSGFWDGVPKAIGMGVMRGGARAAHAVGLAGGGLLSLLERDAADSNEEHGVKAGTLTDPYFRGLDRFIDSAVNYWTPDANSVGTAGRILGGLSEMTLPLMAGGGNPALLVGTTELEGASDLSKQGASNAGAVTGGIIEGAANAIGFKIPFLGSTLATKILSGAAGNVAVGAGAAGAEKLALNLTGDKQIADNIHPLDAEARLIDLLSGMAFGGIAHLAEQPGMRDAVSTAANAKHFQNDTAPGTPADIQASIAHQAAIDEGIRAIMEDRPVDLAESRVQDANFLHDRTPPTADEIPEELKGVDEAVKERPVENPERAELEAEEPGAEPTTAKETVAPSGFEPTNSSNSEEVVHPIVAAAQEALGKSDIQIPTGDLREDGTAITASGRDVMANLAKEVATARNDAKGFDALASCILFRGNG